MGQMTLQDARKQAKAVMREQYGADWWKRADAADLRRAIAKAARAVLALQGGEAPVRVEVTQSVAPATPTNPIAAAAVAQALATPTPAPVLTQTADEIRVAQLREQAHKLYPSDTTQSSTSKHNKAQAQKRRQYLVMHGAPRVQPKEGQMSFGRKFVNGVWVKV